MRHKIERINQYRVKYLNISPGDVLEDDGKFFIAHSKRGIYCSECAFHEEPGYCLVNIDGGTGDKICQTKHGSLIFKDLDKVLENL